MSSPTITAYLKTQCGWSRGVRAALDKYRLLYTEKDVVQSPEFRVEMEQISGQSLTPCVLVNGVLLADVSGAELEAYLLQEKLVQPTDRAAAVPLHGCCSDIEHAAKGLA
ncbi:MAG: glutaredoxin [Verrucomicrobia bacterium]|nr:glutaredoxin [Verrucomicrobiota bacterium]